MIINSTYFSGVLKLPNIESTYPNSAVLGNKPGLDKMIDELEADLMVLAIGNEDYSEFIAQFNADGTLIATPILKWENFINGEVYEVDGKKYNWKGLRYTEGTAKRSLIADYIYSKYLNENSVVMTGAGAQRPTASNSIEVSSIPQVITSWNSFIEKYQGDNLYSGPKFIETSKGTSSGIDWSSDRRNYFVSMYDYFQDKATDFPNVETYLFDMKNSFGI